jgi:hypothetical protein
MADRDEPEASYSEWHGDGTAGCVGGDVLWPSRTTGRPSSQPEGPCVPGTTPPAGYLAVLFEDPEEALRAQRGLRNQGVPENDLRLYDAEETLRIASRLQQERSVLAKAINEVVVDHQARERWLGNARAGGSQLWIYAPTKDRANRLVGLLADCHYLSLHYFGERGIEAVEGDVRSTLTGQGNDRHDPEDHRDQHSGF